jgi:hypothetical protein
LGSRGEELMLWVATKTGRLVCAIFICFSLICYFFPLFVVSDNPKPQFLLLTSG